MLSILYSLVYPNIFSMKRKFEKKMESKREEIEKQKKMFMLFICGNEACVKDSL